MLDKTTIESARYWSSSSDDVALLLETSKEHGLSASEAAVRLEQFGANSTLSAKRAPWLTIILNQLTSPLMLILILAGSVTLFIQHYRDAAFIFVAVVVNAALGFYQENKAERALYELKTYLKQRARVIRDGAEREIDAESIVPGDLIRLAQGDRVPADARVIFVNDLQVDEAVLTGESLPVGKSIAPVAVNAGLADQDSMLFAGTLVTQGVAAAIACRTGSRTEFGKIASLIAASESEKTPLQKAIADFSVFLSFILGALTLGVFLIGIIAGEPVLEMFLTSVAIAVSAIPEGLPVSMTVILAVGVERMARRKGVVRKLVAAEALGSTTVILTDKTGTLTEAKMALSSISPLDGKSEHDILSLALTNTTILIENPKDDPASWRLTGRVMEAGIVRGAASRGYTYADIQRDSATVQFMPFNAVQKFSAALVERRGTTLVVALGAPDILLEASALSAQEKRTLHETIATRASAGERLLGLVIKEVSADGFSFTDPRNLTGFTFAGLIAFRDPIRQGISEAIARVERAGIKTVIMTGDHRGTAVAVAREIGLQISERSVLDASEIITLSDAQLRERLPLLRVISRVTPLDKLRIAKLYQEAGDVVAMTGDGVNDAPSIKQANVGIAMGSGTEVAQSVADLVLLDNNFHTIVAAIEEGRQILANIRKVLVYLLSNVADGLILIGGSLLTGLPLPLNALQILWVNFFSGSFPAVAFAFERDDGLAHRPARTGSLFDPLMKFLILVIGLSSSALLFVMYVVLLRIGFDAALVNTFIFAAFGTYTLLAALSVRSLEHSILSYPFFSNRYLLVGIGIGIALMAAAIYLPLLQTLLGTVSLPLVWVLGVFAVGVFNIALIEIAKYFFACRATRT